MQKLDLNWGIYHKVISTELKMRTTYEKYSNINVPHRYREIVTNLSRNKNIMIMKQDKGRGVVDMDRENILINV